MSDATITLRKAESTWVVRAGGAVLGESENAIVVTEGSYDPVVYFPRGDLAMAFLEKTDHSTHCPHKGDAVYFSIHTKSVVIDNAAWSYETPKDAVADLKDHVAFYASDKVAIERL